MKKTRFFSFAGSLLCLGVILAACKSAPPAQTEPTPAAEPAQNVVEPQAQPADEALTALRDRMEAKRAECLKYGLDSLRSSDWALAEAARKAGLDAYGVTYDISKKSFEEAVSRYETILNESMERMAAEMDSEIAKARENAVAAEVPAYYPEQFALADLAAGEAQALKQAGETAKVYEAGQKALMRYQILLKAREAALLKQKILDNQFEGIDAEKFAQAGTRYDESLAAYGTADPASLDAIQESVRLYGEVKNAGFKNMSRDVIVQVDNAKEMCDSIKASRSAKDAYAEALSTYTAAGKFSQENDWEPAYLSYSKSAEQFTVVYQEVLLKKNAADAAIAAAKDRQAQSSGLAEKADQAAPLPENAEGYPDEPYVLESGVPAAEPVQPVEETAPAAPLVQPVEETAPQAPLVQSEPAVPAATDTVTGEETK